MNLPDYATGMIELVRHVARTEVMPLFRRIGPTDIKMKSRDDDLVTVADLRAEEAITIGIGKLLPSSLVVGEEAVATNPSLLATLETEAEAVVVDPIDGTWNFANGLTAFGMMVAVTERGTPTFGLLYDPVCDDWVVAALGQGAWYCRPEEEPQRLTFTERKGRANGSIPIFEFDVRERRRIIERSDEYARLTNIMCACHEYRMLAMGQIDFRMSRSSMPWDHLAGMLAVVEAGGTITTMSGADYALHDLNTPIIAARSNRIAEQVQSMFKH